MIPTNGARAGAAGGPSPPSALPHVRRPGVLGARRPAGTGPAPPSAAPGARRPGVLGARRAAGTLALAGLGALALMVALAAPNSRFLIPMGPGARPATWLAGPLAGSGLTLSPLAFSVVLVAMLGCYLVAVACAPALPSRLVLGAVAALVILFMVSGPLLSTDLGDYVIYGRLAAVHHLNPYVVAPDAARHDIAFGYGGKVWAGTTDVYGPGFTLLAAVLAPMGVIGGVWALKLVTGLAALACVALVWACARARGRDPLSATALFGLNPLVLVYAVGGAHNDLLMTVPMLAGLLLAFRGRERSGAALAVGAVAVKATAGLAVPFVVLGARRRAAAAAGAAAAAVALAVLGIALFGGASLDPLSVLGRRGMAGVTSSVPGYLAAHTGLPWPGPEFRVVLEVAFGMVALAALAATARRRERWVGAAAVTALALMALSTTLWPWYLVALLPLAALSESRALRAGALILTAVVVVIRTTHWLLPFMDAAHHAVQGG